MKSIFVFIFSILLTTIVQAEFVGAGLVSDENEAVIEDQFYQDLSLEEPLFSSQKPERGLAGLREDDVAPAPQEWQGQLSVVKEIPYSYAWVSHATMRLRALAEIEEEESKKQSASQ